MGGAGLIEQHDDQSFPRWAGPVAGATALLFTIAVAGALYVLNPSFAAGKAFGEPDQVGPLVAAAPAGGGELSAEAAEGRRLLGAKGCGSCHVVPGLATAKGTIGPSLAGVGGRRQLAGGVVPHNSVEDLAAWIMNPQALKPGTAMPAVPMTEDEALKIATFLETLK